MSVGGGLDGGAVDVWSIELDAAPEPPLDDLDADERSRAGRLRGERLRRRFVVAHGATRAILGRYAGVRPGALAIRHAACAACGAAHGKPVLDGAAAGIAFNLSHSEGLALLAVARRTVGVDVEWRGRALDVESLAAEMLAEDELRAFQRLSAARRRDAFFEAWVCKESVVKADGAGLTLPLHDVMLDDDRRGARLRRKHGPPLRFALAPLALSDPAYIGALATVPPAPRVRRLRWPEDLDAGR